MDLGMKLEGRDENDLRMAQDKFGELVRNVVAETVPGAVASIEIGFVRGDAAPGIVVAVPVGGVVARVGIVSFVTELRPSAKFGELLTKRLEEAVRWEKRLAERIEDVREKLLPSLARNGGMRLLALHMEADRLELPIHWYHARLEALFETFDNMLRIEVERAYGHTARDFAGSVRISGKDHVRRERILRRLEAAGAAFEIEHGAERLILERGRTIGDAFLEMMAWSTSKHATPLSDDWGGLLLHEGRIQLHAQLGRRAPFRQVALEELKSA
jgi:hypothetical protein